MALNDLFSITYTVKPTPCGLTVKKQVAGKVKAHRTQTQSFRDSLGSAHGKVDAWIRSDMACYIEAASGMGKEPPVFYVHGHTLSPKKLDSFLLQRAADFALTLLELPADEADIATGQAMLRNALGRSLSDQQKALLKKHKVLIFIKEELYVAEAADDSGSL